MRAVCPVADALFFRDGKASLDMGRCIFCGRCAEVCGKVRFTGEYRLGVFRRGDLIVKAGEKESAADAFAVHSRLPAASGDRSGGASPFLRRWPRKMKAAHDA